MSALPRTTNPALIRIAPSTSTNFGEFLVRFESQSQPQSGRLMP